jgi:hypothetical protein
MATGVPEALSGAPRRPTLPQESMVRTEIVFLPGWLEIVRQASHRHNSAQADEKVCCWHQDLSDSTWVRARARSNS